MSVNEKMTALANAIRAKTGGTSGLSLDGMASAVAGISKGAAVQEITSADTAITVGEAGDSVDVWGYGHYIQSTYSRRTYVFAGDGYYTVSSTTSAPTKTTANFTVGTNGQLSGLPDATFSKLELLVVAEG